jgi:predicted secreted acid phosphatase
MRGVRGCLEGIVPLLVWTAASIAFGLAFPAHGTEPQNLAEFEKQLIDYHDSGAYEHDLQEVASQAIDYIQRRAAEVIKPALVLDIDETSLSNWAKLRANQFAFFPTGVCHLPKGPCGEDSWERMAIATPIQATHDIYAAARSASVTVFFITGRQKKFHRATVKNLRDAGYTEFADVLMEPDGSHFNSAADFKSVQREKIEQAGYTIIANVGDQCSDLVANAGDPCSDLSGKRAEQAFLLPNPFYRIP